MPQEDLALVAPTAALEADFWAMIMEFDAASEYFFNLQLRDLAQRDFAAYLTQLAAYARGEQLPAGYVPSVTYWLVRNGTEIVGCSNLRLQLTPLISKTWADISAMTFARQHDARASAHASSRSLWNRHVPTGWSECC
jgi:predicted acetyltransferase